MLKILVLGGSGILSTAVTQRAVDQSVNVTCITRGNRDFALPKGVKSIHGDANNPNTFINLIDEQYDAIIDFLSYNVSQLTRKFEALFTKTNQFIFVSSATAYKLIETEIVETNKLGNQFWDYSENKIICENYLKKECSKVGINYTIVRPYITYGNTRIPFGVIPDEYWTLANRILCNKPVLLWDNGNAICTLTHTSDFAKGFVDLIGNEKAYNEAFHITSSERLSWREVLEKTSRALGKEPIIFSSSTADIIRYLPEYEGPLTGDKGRNRFFNNKKILNVSKSMTNFKPFDKGIKETVNYFMNNPHERKVNYIWDGKIDRTIIKLAKESNMPINKHNLHYCTSEKKGSIKSYIQYSIGRNVLLYSIYCMLKGKHDFFSLIHKKNSIDIKKFHKFGFKVKCMGTDFGSDLEMISIGDNVYISDNVKFINYRPAAEHFDKIIGDGTKKELRDLGPIIIEDNVFISTGVKLLPNITIGKNTLILEDSVVINDIPENSVVYGNPAKVICSIDEWYNNILKINEKYPWYDKRYDHEKIVNEREKFFFED